MTSPITCANWVGGIPMFLEVCTLARNVILIRLRVSRVCLIESRLEACISFPGRICPCFFGLRYIYPYTSSHSSVVVMGDNQIIESTTEISRSGIVMGAKSRCTTRLTIITLRDCYSRDRYAFIVYTDKGLEKCTKELQPVLYGIGHPCVRP
jgi:hypothetical protein